MDLIVIFTSNIMCQNIMHQEKSHAKLITLEKIRVIHVLVTSFNEDSCRVCRRAIFCTKFAFLLKMPQTQVSSQKINGFFTEQWRYGSQCKERGTNKPYRRNIVRAIIDSCSTKDANAKLIVCKTLDIWSKYKKNYFLKILIAVPCDYKCIIIELVSNGRSSYVSIYIASCHNATVPKDFRSWNKIKTKCIQVQTTRSILKGSEIDNAAIIVICADYGVEKLCKKMSCTPNTSCSFSFQSPNLPRCVPLVIFY